ncbi:MAG: substrate-binding domain-containing protein [Chloroflexota bacterium]
MNKPSTVFERRQVILNLLKEQTSVKVTDLAEILDVSEGTVRNDLQAMDDAGQIRRVRGGAVAPMQYVGMGSQIRERAQINAERKSWLAQWASGQIDTGDVIFLDASTTILSIAPYLVDRTNLTVLTNGVEVARAVAANPTNTVILAGNLLSPDGNSLLGPVPTQLLETLHIRAAFFSCAGLSEDLGLLERDIQEAAIKRQLVDMADTTIALIDSSKVGKGGLSPFANWDAVDHVVTDTDMLPRTVEAIRKTGTQVTICGEETVATYASYDTNGQYRIGFANISEEMPFGRDVRRGLEAAIHGTSSIELIIADNQLNPDIALRVADHLIEQEVDLAIEYQIDEQVGNLISNKFNAHNIPVIAVDIPMVGATFFGVDNYKAGMMAGRVLGEHVLKEWDNQFDFLVVLEHPRAGNLPAMRIQGQIDGFQAVVGQLSRERVIRLDSGNTTQVSANEMRVMMQQFGNNKRFAVVSFNDDAAVGALLAAQELNCEANVLIVGQGGDRRLRLELRKPGSRVVGSTAFRPEEYGRKLIELATSILAGDSVPPAVYIDHVFIDADNVDTYYPVDLNS